MTVPAAVPPVEWLRDVQVLRECRGLQAQLAELGIRVPMLDLLVLRGHLRRDLLPAGQVCCGDPLTHAPEDEVLARLRAEGRIADAEWGAACKLHQTIAGLGVSITLGTLLQRRGSLRSADFTEFDRDPAAQAPGSAAPGSSRATGGRQP